MFPLKETRQNMQEISRYYYFFLIVHNRGQHNIVKQLSSSKKKKRKTTVYKPEIISVFKKCRAVWSFLPLNPNPFWLPFFQPYAPSFQYLFVCLSSVQFSSVAQLCLTLCDPMDCSTPGLPVHHQLPEFTQTHVHRVGDAIQPSHPLSSPSLPAPNLSQHQGFFPMSQLFTSRGQSTGVSASTSVLPMNIQGWFPLRWTSWNSLQSKGLSRVFSNTTVQKQQFFGV